jgi:hypothetical protein
MVLLEPNAVHRTGASWGKLSISFLSLVSSVRSSNQILTQMEEPWIRLADEAGLTGLISSLSLCTSTIGEKDIPSPKKKQAISWNLPRMTERTHCPQVAVGTDLYESGGSS